MFDENVKKELKLRFDTILFDEPLKKHTTMGVGGPADGFLHVEESEIDDIYKFCNDNTIPLHVMGNGSNTVGLDGGYRGVVISIGKRMNNIELISPCTLQAQAGAKLSAVAEVAARNGIGGFEYLAGIPGNLGGALVMNAGAYGGEIKNIVETVTYFRNGEYITVSADEIGYGYRKSFFIDNPDCIIISAKLKGYIASEEQIRALMAEYAQKRAASQPLEYPSSGSFFKRPEGYFAGKLVQDCGLKGYSVGGAAVSEKHAGFVINTGGATGSDIKKLAAHIQKCVKEQFGVDLHPEVRFLGCDE